MVDNNENGNNFNKGRLVQKVADHDRRLAEHDGVHKEMWIVLDKMRNRPPVWCTIIICILTAVVGWLARAASL